MKNQLLKCIAFVAMLLPGLLSAQQLAFPGAEGFGRFSQGARASTTPSVYHVTNLNDAGAGSFRDAISQPNRFVVFDVSGVIKITSPLAFSSNITVAGQTAPGDGVIVYGNRSSLSGCSNVIIRYMRFYMGKGGAAGKDAFGLANGSGMIFDHCSILWGLDETFSISWDGKGTEPADITIQNSIIGQGLEPHSAGGLIQTDGGVSILNTLYIDNSTRNPKVKGLNQFINNVVYNWGSGGGYILGDSSGKSWAWLEGNYFIAGPSASGGAFTRANTNFSLFHQGDKIDTDRNGVANGRLAEDSDYGNANFVSSSSSFVDCPKPHPAITGGVLTADQALEKVINEAGASLPVRSDVDAFLIDQLISYGIQGKSIGHENQNGIYQNIGVVSLGSKQPDSDSDGMSDAWEDANGLNKNNSNDALFLASNGYYNIENYVNSIVAPTDNYMRAPNRLQMIDRTTNSITIGWTDRAVGADGFIIEASDGGDFREVGQVGSGVNVFTHSGLTEESFYTYRIRSKKSGIDSSTPSETIKIQVLGTPKVPYASITPSPAVDATSRFYTQFSFAWENLSGPWAGALTYDLYFGDSEATLSKVASGLAQNSFVYIPSSSCLLNTEYFWRVDATNSLGTTVGPIWKFRSGSYSFTTTVADLGRDFIGSAGNGIAENAQSGVQMASNTSYTINNEFRFSVGGGASMNTSTSNGVYQSSANYPFMYGTSDNADYIEGAVMSSAEYKNIAKVYINGTTADVTVGSYIGIVYSKELLFNPKAIVAFDEFFLPACRKGENKIVLTAPEGVKSFRIYRKVSVMPIDGADGVYEISSNPAANALGGGGHFRIAYLGAELELLSDDDPAAKSRVNTLETFTVNGVLATIDNTTKLINVLLPFGSQIATFPVAFTLTDVKATTDFTSGSSFDFSAGTLKVKVTSEAGDERIYTVKIHIASGETPVDLGIDWNAKAVNATSGVLLSGTAGNTSEYIIYPDTENQLKVTPGGGASINRSSNNVYTGSNTFSAIALTADNTHYINIALTDNSVGKMIASLKINGTSDNTSNGVTVGVLYCETNAFDPNAIIGSSTAILSKCRAGNSGVLLTDMPFGTKSIRIYRKVTIIPNGDIWKIGTGAGAMTIGSGAYNPRIAYLCAGVMAGQTEISKFSIGKYDAQIDQENKKISLELPYLSDLTQVTPSLTLGGAAVEYSPQGPQNFSEGPIVYTVSDANKTVDYTVTITARQSPDENTDISTLTVNGHKAHLIDVTDGIVRVELPYNTPIEEWKVEYELSSEFSTADIVSGNNYSFADQMLKITVTAQGNQQKHYTIYAVPSLQPWVAMLTVDGKEATYDQKLVSCFQDYKLFYLNAADQVPTNFVEYCKDYDLIILHANVSGGNAIANGLRNLVGIKPILNLKAYNYSSGRWDWASPSNTELGRLNCTVPVELQNHQLFKGVHFDGDKLQVYTSSSPATNSYQYCGPLNGVAWTEAMTAANNTIATIDGDDAKIHMHELNLSNSAKYLMIGWSNEADAYTLFNANALAVLENAAAYLLDSSAAYDYSMNAPTQISQSLIDKKLYYLDGVVYNPDGVEIRIYAQGQLLLISNMTQVNVSALSGGFYIAHSPFGNLKFIK